MGVTVYQEINELHRDCMAMVNRLSRVVAKALAELELMEEQTHAAISLYRSLTVSGDGNLIKDGSETTTTSTAPMRGCVELDELDDCRQTGAATAGQ